MVSTTVTAVEQLCVKIININIEIIFFIKIFIKLIIITINRIITDIKNTILIFILIIFTQSCSTAVTVVDTTTSVAINTVKGVVHYSTCPFTKKECF